MKKILVGSIIAVIAIITLVIAWGAGFGATPYYETKAEFGMWQEEVYVKYADGTEHSFKLIDRNNLFSVYYDGQEISEIGIRISAEISGTVYEGAELKFESFAIERKIIDASNQNIVTSYTAYRPGGDEIIEVPLGAIEECIYTRYLSSYFTPSSFPNGAYNVVFKPVGIVKYRGYPDGGDWEIATLPSERVVGVTVYQGTASITVTLGSEVTT